MGQMRLFNDGWSFLKTPFGTEPGEIENRREEFAPVDIPHDWLIYQTRDLYEDGTGWYRKCFSRESLALGEGERAVLRFEGVYMDSTLYVNGQRAGDWKYGYSTFDFDITELLREGENELLMQVRFRSPNSRWYSGAGIYRDVWLKVYPRVYLPLDGLYVTAKPVSDHEKDSGRENVPVYRLEVSAQLGGEVTEDTRCRFSLWRGEELAFDLGWQQAVRREKDTYAWLERVLEPVQEWDVEDPVCYRLRAQLYRGEEPVDCQETPVGFRRIYFDREKGLYLNGRHIKLHGVCEHHDLGCLGAAFHREAMKRKLILLRKMGVNALRTSHNMPAKAVMELADEMGILVVSEAFDMWERPKTEYDYGRFFREWAGRDVASWVRRDRNHPSLLMWSIGNEIYDTHADEHGQEITARLLGYVRDHDPRGNAPVTIGSNYMPWEGAQRCADILKVAGYNYGERLYEAHHRAHPDWVIYGSETASVVHSRGVYRFPLSQSVLSDEDEQCSALGNCSTSWGAKNIETCIAQDREAPFCLGQFVWTGFDYIGEPTPYHTKNSYFGQLDTAGFPKDSYYIFQAEWTDPAKAPMVHLFPYWDFNPGQLIDLRACTNGESVELFVNGVSQGLHRIDHAHGTGQVGCWQVPYRPGEVTAVAYDGQGREIARETRRSFGDGVRLSLEAERQTIKGDGEDLAFVTVTVLDREGNPVENAMDYVEITVEGAGRLVGMDNGDSTDYDPYKTNVRKLFNGKLLAVVAAKDRPGQIRVKAASPSLAGAQILLEALPASPREGYGFREDLMEHPAHGAEDAVPVRKVEIRSPEGQSLGPEKKSLLLEARVYPENASDGQILWRAVNQNGIPIGFAQVEEISRQGSLHTAKVTALGDGDFLIRCLSGADKVRIISQLEFRAAGLGQAGIDPYRFVSAGLFTDTVGNIGNGNEKGIATDREAASAVVYSHLDFGDYGSDEITVPIFALDGKPYEVEFWLGRPGQEGSRLLLQTVYQKPSVWNVYQEETWRLPERIKGDATLAIRMHDKVHIKGFVFKKYEKGLSRIWGAECTEIYGDSYRVEERAVTGIGNNVTIAYDNMDFGSQGVSHITFWGRSPLAGNTVHIHFVREDGTRQTRVVEVPGTAEYTPLRLALEPLAGKGRIEFVFLPGSSFDLEQFQFER